MLISSSALLKDASGWTVAGDDWVDALLVDLVGISRFNKYTKQIAVEYLLKFIRGLFLFLAFAVTVVPVFAGGNDQDLGLNFDGSFRLMTQEDSTSTSKCIGNPISPICAFETYLACRVRDNNELCEIANGEKTGSPTPFKLDKNRIVKTGYRIMAIRQYTPQHMPAPSRNRIEIKPWDVGVTLDTANCTYGKCDGPYPDTRVSYLLRQRGDVWFVVFEAGYQRDYTDHCHVGYYDCKFGQ